MGQVQPSNRSPLHHSLRKTVRNPVSSAICSRPWTHLCHFSQSPHFLTLIFPWAFHFQLLFNCSSSFFMFQSFCRVSTSHTSMLAHTLPSHSAFQRAWRNTLQTEYFISKDFCEEQLPPLTWLVALAGLEGQRRWMISCVFLLISYISVSLPVGKTNYSSCWSWLVLPTGNHPKTQQPSGTGCWFSPCNVCNKDLYFFFLRKINHWIRKKVVQINFLIQILNSTTQRQKPASCLS